MRMIMKTYLFRCCAVPLLIMAGSLTALGQTVTAAITGLVTDPSGAVVAGATVTAENTATGVRTAAQTNGAGAYTIRFLPIGSYTVSVDAKGFARSKVDPFALEIDQTAKINVALKVNTSDATVEVKAEAHSMIGTTHSTTVIPQSTLDISAAPLYRFTSS